MVGLVPAIHVFQIGLPEKQKVGIPATSAGMTEYVERAFFPSPHAGEGGEDGAIAKSEPGEG